MSATDLTLHGWGWLRAALGLAVFLLPGLAAADRWLKGVPLRLGWAPVLSFTVMALAAILLDFAAGLNVRTTTSVALAFILAAWIAKPRLISWWRQRARLRLGPWRLPRMHWGPAWGLLLVLPFLFVAHSVPHLDGPVPSSKADVPGALWERALDAATGNDDPYPVHVDEHLHMAFMAEIDRTGEVRVAHPYTGAAQQEPTFTVSGLRSERGWQVAIVQFHQVTAIPFPTLAHFLPALWAAYLGLTLWLLLRPAPGAVASAAFTALLPTTLRFLGVGFLVPSAFGLPWILAVMVVVHRGRGPGRIVALALLVTSGFFIHIVPGTVALVGGLVTALLRRAGWGERLGLVAAMLLPLVWLLPSMWGDAEAAVKALNDLPFEQGIFHSIGTPLAAAAVAGTAWAWFQRDERTVPHRALSIIALGAAASMSWSIDQAHSNDATYGRLVPVLFLALAAVAGLGIGVPASWIGAGLRRWTPAWGAVAVGSLLVTAGVVAGVMTPLQAHLREPYYRVFDGPSWAAAEDFAAGSAGPDDVFLSHPWRAPLLNAMTGARPWTYLLPGSPPVNGADYDDYMVTSGADRTWLESRGITYVVGGVPPNAPHEIVGRGVHRLNETQ